MQSGDLPLIGITCHVDEGSNDDIFPGRALNYIDRTYADVLITNNMIPVMVPVNRDLNYVEAILSRIDGLLCTGGGKIPQRILNQPRIPDLEETAYERYNFEKELFTKALEMDIPMLGMCRSMQTINEIRGGKLHSKISFEIPEAIEHNQTYLSLSLEEPYHKILIEKDSHLARILETSEIEVNSWHSQSIKEAGNGFRIVARAEDGVVEAIESVENTFVVMTQFHPEILYKKNPYWGKLFEEFRLKALEYKNRRRRA